MKLMGNRKLFVSEQLLARDLDSGCQQSVNKTVDKWNRRFWWFEIPYEHAKPISYRYPTLMTFGACPDQHSPQENLFKFSVNNFVNNFVDKIVDTFSISILEKITFHWHPKLWRSDWYLPKGQPPCNGCHPTTAFRRIRAVFPFLLPFFNQLTSSSTKTAGLKISEWFSRRVSCETSSGRRTKAALPQSLLTSQDSILFLSTILSTILLTFCWHSSNDQFFNSEPGNHSWIGSSALMPSNLTFWASSLSLRRFRESCWDFFPYQ